MSGGKIKEYRQRSNYSQKELANLVGVNQRTIMRWEQNQTQPNTEEAKKLMEIIGIPFPELIESDSVESISALDKISDSVDNLVTGQETINRSIMSGTMESREHQEEIIKELRKQNDELLNSLEETRRSFDFQKEVLKQKKTRNIILLVFVIVIVILVAIFLWILASGGTDPKEIYAGKPELYTTN